MHRAQAAEAVGVLRAELEEARARCQTLQEQALENDRVQYRCVYVRVCVHIWCVWEWLRARGAAPGACDEESFTSRAAAPTTADPQGTSGCVYIY